MVRWQRRRMVQEEQRYSNINSGGGGGRSSKKLKQKKVPQRGLGVAQLEKIRLEEQQKDAAAAAVGGSSVSFVIPSPSHHHQLSSSSTIFPPSPSDVSSMSPLFRPTPPLPISNFFFVSPPPPPTMTNLYGCSPGGGGGGSGPVTSISASVLAGHGHFPTVLSAGNDSRLDPGPCHTHLPNGSDSVWRPSVLMRGKQQQSSMVNVPSLTSSSRLNFLMEPPSNQSCCGSNHTLEPPSNQTNCSDHTLPLLPEDEKNVVQMVGNKRPWPFSLDELPLGLCKFAQIIKPIYRPEESSFCRSTLNFEPGNAICSEDTSGSTAFHVDWRESTSKLKENSALDGDFLTLGRPATVSSSMNSESNQPLAFPTSHYPKFSDFELPQSQGSIEHPLLPIGRSIQQQPIYSLFPPQELIGRAVRGEAGDRVDLNLKL